MADRATGKVNQHGLDMGMKAYETRGLTDADVDNLVEVRQDNTEAVIAALNEAIARGLEEMGLVAEGYAKAGCPVDTGRLRNSITHVVDPDNQEVSIGTNVEYGRHVEFREDVSHENGHAHFLRDAASEHAAEYAQIMRAALGGK
ncbi:HK97 gp10 family phage protein [Olsenella umbonata]|uniref:HK97 gp10 family phage protein n=1 Tax=Parafannyhessea umbonata TaxID=604330 RepID=A0A7X9XZ65_9ACTN|nr:HK97 gp10 family phage protein [Parafannyhessea umbonata]NMF25076.1 HK97 gp10 family phage protein [Parafannyhessea umbonata]